MPGPYGQEWLRMDFAELGKQEGIDFDALLESATSQDPAQVLSYLRAVSDDVREVGREAVRGVETTHYSATVDLRKAVDLAPAELRETVEATTERLVEPLGRSTFPVEIWIDADGRARRYSQELPLQEVAGSSATTTYDMYDFGVEVDIDVPPEEDVVDYSEMMALSGG